MSKKSRPQDSTMFTKTTDNFDFTNVTVSNQTSIWKTDKIDDDDDEEEEAADKEDKEEIEEDEDDFDNRVKFDTEDKPFERSMQPQPVAPANELSTLSETNILITLAGANATMNVPANNSNSSICSKLYDDKKNLSRMFHLSKADFTTNTSI